MTNFPLWLTRCRSQLPAACTPSTSVRVEPDLLRAKRLMRARFAGATNFGNLAILVHSPWTFSIE